MSFCKDAILALSGSVTAPMGAVFRLGEACEGQSLGYTWGYAWGYESRVPTLLQLGRLRREGRSFPCMVTVFISQYCAFYSE